MEEMKGVRRMETLDPLRSTGLILHPTNSSCQERYQDFFDFSFLYFIFSFIFIFNFNLITSALDRHVHSMVSFGNLSGDFRCQCIVPLLSLTSLPLLPLSLSSLLSRTKICNLTGSEAMGRTRMDHGR